LPTPLIGQRRARLQSEDSNMRRYLILTAFALSAALIAPVAARADDRNHQDKRYYDKHGKDYHTWNNNEDRAYRQYLTDQHRDYRDFNRTNRSQQQQYFTWRHNHDDNSLFKVEIR
jgi:type III secretory pathway component EscR